MSQVHSVTHVPVHSPLSEACLPYAARSAGTIRVGVAGRNGPAEVGRGGRTRPQQGGNFLPSIKGFYVFSGLAGIHRLVEILDQPQA
jgi:hypothetical protein